MFNLLRTKFYPVHDSGLEPDTLLSRFIGFVVRITAGLKASALLGQLYQKLATSKASAFPVRCSYPPYDQAYGYGRSTSEV